MGSPSTLVAADEANRGWIVSDPQEIVGYLLFDPISVADRLPETLRFITVEELAGRGVDWAADHLADEPVHGGWGISFFEIVRMGTLTIEGRAPEWPEGGAVALWLARVAPSGAGVNPGSGTPLLMLEFWMPDAGYVEYMQDRGYHAMYGEVTLGHDAAGTWRGTVSVDGLNVSAECSPCGPITGGAGSFAQQVFVPPRSSISDAVVQLDLSGHRIQDCASGSFWEFVGTHPLASSVVLGPSTFQFGYDLRGAVLEP